LHLLAHFACDGWAPHALHFLSRIFVFIANIVLYKVAVETLLFLFRAILCAREKTTSMNLIVLKAFAND